MTLGNAFPALWFLRLWGYFRARFNPAPDRTAIHAEICRQLRRPPTGTKSDITSLSGLGTSS
ncbi:hypothetical protein CN090_01865 [Sinorhizobium meliloti]|nr:hypothetical protein SMRU11_13295 [Sinorhizobium meliloti RU11/001]ASP82374.1 hypothetical protein CDO27_31945 [Sinorhizobium meliloti]MQW18536.1 hypothetical protein [Sinorhizobium meliloti]MQW19858.1 hypothetical protein [Sinorhizobium meliloti]MQW21323.1 hypothetical protein [Sinorhizobium meliloti]